MKKTFKKISEFICKAENLAGQKNYNTSLQFLEKAKPYLEEMTLGNVDFNDFYEEWGFYYKIQFIDFQGLKNGHELLNVSHEVLSKFDLEEAIKYSHGFRIMLFSIRKAHTFLALDYLEKNDLDKAIEEIEKCFVLKRSSSEYFDPFLESYESRALIYFEAFKCDPEKYSASFFSALEKLELRSKTEYSVNISSRDLEQFLQNEQFLQFKQNKPIEKLRRGLDDETWQDALTRFKNIGQVFQVDLESKVDEGYFRLDVHPKITVDHLQLLQKKCDCKLPDSLLQMYVNHGAFSVGDRGYWGTFRIYSNEDKYLPLFGGLVEMIDSLWGGRPEFGDSFSTEQINFLNSNYFVFGHFFWDDNAYTHFYFTADSRIGTICYHQDDWSEMQLQVYNLLKPSEVQTCNFDKLISEQVDLVIEKLFEREEEAQLEA